MYSLVIVDDETEFIDAVKCVIDFKELDIDLLATQDNGRSGLDFISSHRPDIILCDIGMPIMDGNQMLSEVAKIPDYKPQVIMFTGFDDFAHAKEAIAHNILDYIVKPCLPDELIESLEKAKRACDEQKTHLAHSTYIKNLQRESFLMKLITGSITDEQEILINEANFKINLKSDYYQLLNIIALDKQFDKEAELKLISESLEGSLVTYENDYSIFLLVTFPINDVTALCENIVKKSPSQILASFSAPANTLKDIPALYSQTEYCSKFKFSYETGTVISYTDAHSYIHETFKNGGYERFEGKLVALLNNGNADYTSFINTLEGIQSELHYYSPDYLKNAVYKALYTLFSHMLNIDDEEYNTKKSTMWTEINETKSIGELVALTKALLDYIKQIISKPVSVRQAVLTEKVKEYINQNYAEQITVSALSKLFYISESHLRSIFHDAMGISISDYIRDYRMQRAMDLLKLKQYKIYEVARMVGYNDVKTFRQNFTDKFGVAPSEVI